MHLSDKYFITISNDGKFASQDEPAGYNNSTPTSTLTQFLRAAKFRSNLSTEAEQHTPLDSTQDRKASVLISKYYLCFYSPLHRDFAFLPFPGLLVIFWKAQDAMLAFRRVERAGEAGLMMKASLKL